jgi:hypothetical protein
MSNLLRDAKSEENYFRRCRFILATVEGHYRLVLRVDYSYTKRRKQFTNRNVHTMSSRLMKSPLGFTTVLSFIDFHGAILIFFSSFLVKTRE